MIFKLNRYKRQQIKAGLLMLAPLLTAVSKVLNGDMEPKAAIAWLLADLPIAIGAVMMHPPQPDPNGTDDIHPPKGQPNG